MPALRVRAANRAPINPDGDFVLYWMISARRLEWNYALDRAVTRAEELRRSLLVFEPLRCGYRWASHRLHRFCIDGMAEHSRRLKGSPIGYFVYVEPQAGAGRGLLEALAKHAAVVVTDEFPAFFLPAMVSAAADRLPVRLEVVDSNGILPLRAPDRDFTTAYSFRRHLQRTIRPHLEGAPSDDPLRGARIPAFRGLPDEIAVRWPKAPDALLNSDPGTLEALPIDPHVPPVPFQGGRSEATRRLDRFLERSVDRYAEHRNQPDRERTSGLSPHLHWGHISAHEVVHALLDREGWHPGLLSDRPDGRRSGWWGLGVGPEAFLDQLVTWRELGFQTAVRLADPEAYDTLPEWARTTLEAHEDDPRPHVYEIEEFETARTHDPLWNAAQRELRSEGTIHGYLRMLWGKKILHWTESPRHALRVMIELNNRWGVDGRDPNSTSGILWTMGRYDRGWPERPVFGKVRSMTSKSTRRKLDLAGYLERFGSQETLGL